MKVRQGYIKDSIGFVPLTQGKEALCDAHWFHYLNQFNWCAKYSDKNGRWYAARTVRLLNGKRTTQRMHRLIMSATDPAVEIDHKNGDGLLNTEENLRFSTHAQNLSNRGSQTGNASGHKGVGWFKRYSKWRAQIGVNGKMIHLGYFADKVEAALAYDAAALKYHGEFAVLNFPVKKPAARAIEVAAPNERKLAA